MRAPSHREVNPAGRDPAILPPRPEACPQCDYAITGLPGRVCPECGHDTARQILLRGQRWVVWLYCGVIALMLFNLALMTATGVRASWTPQSKFLMLGATHTLTIVLFGIAILRAPTQLRIDARGVTVDRLVGGSEFWSWSDRWELKWTNRGLNWRIVSRRGPRMWLSVRLSDVEARQVPETADTWREAALRNPVALRPASAWSFKRSILADPPVRTERQPQGGGAA